MVRTYRQDNLGIAQSFGTAFDVYVCIYNVDLITPGVYLYNILNNSLILVKEMPEKKLRDIMYKAQVEQEVAYTASAAILISCEFVRNQWRYRHEAALKQLYIDCGQAMHPMILLATAFSLKTHISPAISDSVVLDLLKLDKIENQVMYILSIG